MSPFNARRFASQATLHSIGRSSNWPHPLTGSWHRTSVESFVDQEISTYPSQRNIYAQESFKRESTGERARYLKRPARFTRVLPKFKLWLSFRTSCLSNWKSGSPRNDRAAQPHAGRHHDPSRSLTKNRIGSRRANFYQLHLLFDKHYGEQSELVDTIAERITSGRNLHRHGRRRGNMYRASAQGQGRGAGADFPPARRAPDHHRALPQTGQARRQWMTLAPTIWWSATVLRTNELQVWFISEHPGGYASGCTPTTRLRMPANAAHICGT